MLCSKSTIAIFVLIIIAVALLNQTSLLRLIPELLGWLLLVGAGAITWAVFYAAFGFIIWHAATRNIPMVLSGFVFCICVSILLVLLFELLLGNATPSDHILMEFKKVSVLITLGMIVVLIGHQDLILKELNTEDRAFPVWTRTYVNEPKDPEGMPAVFLKHILFIKTANQYIDVHTSNGQYELRMSLTKAETFLDDAIGLRVHRSHWVRHTEMQAVNYQNGNPFVMLKDGQSLPIGRNMVDTVKEIIASR
jgi:hypothetical protein